MKIYLGYIPFISVDGILQGNGDGTPFFLEDDKNDYTQVDIDNFRLLDNGNISFIIDLGVSSISKLDYDKYNAVIIPISESRYRFYKIKSIAYTSASNYLVTAIPSYLNATDNDVYIDPSNLKSKTSFIKYGYAYDSLVDNDGYVNLDRNGSSDIYIHNPNIDKPSLPAGHIKIPFNYCYHNSTLTNQQKVTANELINRYIIGWLIVYLKLGCKEVEGSQYELKSCYYKTEDCTEGIKQPYTCLVAPIINKRLVELELPYGLEIRTTVTDNDQTYTVRITDSDQLLIYLDKFISNGSANIIYSKVTKTMPIREELINYAEYFNWEDPETLGAELRFSLGRLPLSEVGVDSDYYLSYRVNSQSIISLVTVNLHYLDGRIKHSQEIPFSELEAYGYPTCFKEDTYITKTQFKDYRTNPYVMANTYSIKIRDMVGGDYEYTPLHLGHFDSLKINALESLTPDTTKEFVWVDPSSTDDGLIAGHYAKQNFMGLINSIDLSYPYSQDQLDIFLANNKNFYLQKVNKVITTAGIGVGASLVSGNPIPAVAGLVGADGQLWDMAFQIDNLRNAPEIVSNVNGNVFFNIQYSDFGFYLDIYTTTNLIKKSIYQDFVTRGLYLNRYLDDSEVHKYVSITDNKWDKRYYKHIEGNFNFYTDNIVSGNYANMFYVKKLNELYKKITIYSYNNLAEDNVNANLVSHNPTYEMEVLSLVDEEEVNE